MPLTRHLYREDEVAAALAWSILRGRLRETAFWTLEMLDSGLLEEFATVGRWIWAFGFGIAAPSWLAAFEAAFAGEELDAGVLVGLTVGLARSGATAAGRDASVLGLLLVPAGTVPDRVGPGKKEPAAQEPLGAYLERAVRQGRAVATWLAVRAAGEGGWEMLLAAATAKHGAAAGRWIESLKGAGGGPEQLAAACAGACLPPLELERRLVRELPAVPQEVLADVERWSGLTGRRARRELPIPVDCLYWLTARGREQSVYDSNEKELMGRLEKSKGLWYSTYWDGVVEELGGWAAVRSDDAVREAFYMEHFPDDIPDEWSKADRAKSHGGGVLQRGAVATGGEWLRRWFGSLRSAVLWEWFGGGVGTAGAPAAAPAAGHPEPHPLKLFPQATEPVDASSWTLKPARRIIELKSAA